MSNIPNPRPANESDPHRRNFGLRNQWFRLKRRLAYLGSLALLKIIDWMLRTWGYRRTSRWLVRFSPTPDAARSDSKRARILALAVDSAATQRLVDVTCLRRSLALWWLLRWLRIPSEVRLAFRLANGKADGHAWVEHHAQVINDLPDIAAHYPILYGDQLSPEMAAKI